WHLPPPPPLSSEVVALEDTHPDTLDMLMQRLADVVGVEDVMVVPEERLMYLKVNRQALDRAALDELIPPSKP
ncbi:MFS transporter, partial [Halomonas sp. 707D4]|nr:MFS transporter [Halomonas sp. 707D4]